MYPYLQQGYECFRCQGFFFVCLFVFYKPKCHHIIELLIRKCLPFNKILILKYKLPFSIPPASIRYWSIFELWKKLDNLLFPIIFYFTATVLLSCWHSQRKYLKVVQKRIIHALCDTRINAISVPVASTNWPPFSRALTERLRGMDLETKLPSCDLRWFFQLRAEIQSMTARNLMMWIAPIKWNAFPTIALNLIYFLNYYIIILIDST